MTHDPKTPLGEKLLAIRNRAIANGMRLKTREEIMNEAPTDDVVEKSLSNVACDTADYSDCTVLRAHIAALEHKHDDLVTRCVQAESDRDALEAKLAEQIREDEMRLINHCIKIIDNNSRSHLHAEAEFLTKIAELEEQINLMSKHQAGVDEKLCELEAENKRLREVLRTCEGRILNAQIGINTGDTKAGLSKYLDAVLSIVRNAIAQTGEKS